MSIASELTVLQGYIGDAYDVVDYKGGAIPTDKNMANLATAIDSIPGGGSAEVVNGVIAEYKASYATVDANTFVGFVSSIQAGTDTQISTVSGSYPFITAAALSSNTIFIVHGDASNNALYGLICTISGTTITPGASIQLTAATNSRQDPTIVALDTNTVFITYQNTADLYGMVCTVSGTTITPGQETPLSVSTGSNYPFMYVSSTKLSSSSVFVAHRNGNQPYGLVCTISGTTITPGTETQLVNTTGTYGGTAVALSSNKVFLTYRSSSNYYGRICTISGTTITPGTGTKVSSGSQQIYPVALNQNLVFIVRTEDNYPHGLVCTISGNTIMPGTWTRLSNDIGTYSSFKFAVLSLDRNSLELFIACSKDNYSYGIFVTGYGSTSTTITPGTTNSWSFAPPIAISPDTVFFAHGAGNYISGKLCKVSETVSPALNPFGICGLTKTECTTTTAGEVWVLAT